MKAEIIRRDVIPSILAMEWAMFTTVSAYGGRAPCQDNYGQFILMRLSQFLSWDKRSLCCYFRDLYEARKTGRNMMTEKYGYMMKSTHSQEYEQIKLHLPAISERKKALISKIVSVELQWMDSIVRAYPNIRLQGRVLKQTQEGADETSFETYRKGELCTYSIDTLQSLWQHVTAAQKEGKNLNEDVLIHMTRLCGKEHIGQL
jgi:hypothetical protein